MKVDMSPEEVTARLRTMDDLWLLSVKLMNAKKVRSAESVENGAVQGKAEIRGSSQRSEADLSETLAGG